MVKKLIVKESRFLRELPGDDLIWTTEKTKADPEESKERGKAHLSNIRSLLK